MGSAASPADVRMYLRIHDDQGKNEATAAALKKSLAELASRASL